MKKHPTGRLKYYPKWITDSIHSLSKLHWEEKNKKKKEKEKGKRKAAKREIQTKIQWQNLLSAEVIF